MMKVIDRLVRVIRKFVLQVVNYKLFFRANIIYALLLLLSNIVLTQALYAQGSTLRKDTIKATLDYAQAQTRATIKAGHKAAVLALYKRLYKSGTNKSLNGALARIALSTNEINQLAESTADALSSNDPEKAQLATEALAISLGTEMAKFAKNPALRSHLSKIMGKAGSIKEVSGLLGAAGTNSGNRAIAEYAGSVLINLTPASGVVGFYKSAYGVMKYADDQFNASQMEELYQLYKKNNYNREERTTELTGLSIYSKIIRLRRMDLVAKRKALIADATDSASVKLREYLTKSTDAEIDNEILTTFKQRLEKEQRDLKLKAKHKVFVKEATIILGQLSGVANKKYKKDDDDYDDWYTNHSWDLTDFTNRVRKALAENGILDPHNELHIRLMSRLMATRLIYGRNSQEALAVLEEFNNVQKSVLSVSNNGDCSGDSSRLARSLKDKGFRLLKKNKPEYGFKYLHRALKACQNDKLEYELAKLEKEYREDKDKFLKEMGKDQEKRAKIRQKEKRDMIFDHIKKIKHVKFKKMLKKLNIKSPDNYENCLCQNAGYGSPGTRQFYHPGTLGKYNEAYTCQHPGEPCVVAGYGCTRHPLPTNKSIVENCQQKYLIDMKKTKDGKIDPKSGIRLDDMIVKKLKERSQNTKD